MAERPDLDQAEHLRHMTDGRWHDDCWHCRRRREQGGTGLTNPPDLDQAIQAATNALRERVSESVAGGTWWRVDYVSKVARIAVEAAWPLLGAKPRATQAELGDLNRDLEWRLHEASNERATCRDRLADLEVYAAELHGALSELFDLLHTLTLSPRERASINVREPQPIEARVRAALQAVPPEARV